MNDDKQQAQHSPDQQSWSMLTFLLGTTIFADLSNHCHFHYLVNLVNLDRVKYMSWGVHVYSTLIRRMRKDSGRLSVLMGSNVQVYPLGVYRELLR